jgi:hypothetical protein
VHDKFRSKALVFLAEFPRQEEKRRYSLSADDTGHGNDGRLLLKTAGRQAAKQTGQKTPPKK